MPAVENFRKTIKRAEAMISLHKTLCPRGKPKVEYSDILRAAVVISVAAMDGYFHERIPESLAPFVRAKKGKNLPGRLLQIVKDSVCHDRLIEILFEERPLSHLVTIVRKATADRTYQDAGKIEQAVGMLGVDDLWFKVGQKLKLSKEKAKNYVQSYVGRRHQIVHRGDYGQTKRSKNQVKPMGRAYAQRCVREVGRFVEAIDEVIEAAVAELEKKRCPTSAD